MVVQNELIIKKKIFSCIQKLKSSVINEYCLFCKTKIIEPDHHCEQIELIGDKIVEMSLGINNNEIIQELNCDLLKNQEFAQNIKNKIIAYSL